MFPVSADEDTLEACEAQPQSLIVACFIRGNFCYFATEEVLH